MRLFATGLAILLAALPAGGQAPASADEAARWLVGTYDTREQAVRDAEVPALRMLIVAVPKSRLSFGSPVLYLEEAPAGRPDRPSRQRFLRVETDAQGAIVLRTFDLKDGSAAAGKWQSPSDLALFGRNDVRERTPCAVTLKKVEDHYEGVASDVACVPAFVGVTRASSEIRVFSDRVETWDRGFGPKNVQLFGAVLGPYLWKKRSAVAPQAPGTAAPEPDR